jgi:isopenicillin N synthase-like dioxygenase
MDEVVITKMALDEFRNAVPLHIDNARKLAEWRADKEMWQKDLMSVRKQLVDVLAEDFDNHCEK